MGSPSYDLRSLCSSPLFYRDGDDFLGQPVNDIYDEDLSFDFLEDFGIGLAITKEASEPRTTTLQGEDQVVTNKTQTFKPNNFDTAVITAHKTQDDKKTFKAESNNTVRIFESNSFLARTCTCLSVSAGGITNDVTNTKTKSLLSNGLRAKTDRAALESPGLELTENHALLSIDHCNGTKSSSQDAEGPFGKDAFYKQLEKGSTRKNFKGKRTVFNDAILPTQVRYTTSGKSSVSKKTSSTGSNRAVEASKPFRSPFSKPGNCIVRQENSTEGDNCHAQQNVDVVHSCNIMTHKRDAKKRILKIKSEAGYGQDGKKYMDFLKRNADFEKQGNHSGNGGQDKRMNEAIQKRLDEAKWTNEEQLLSLPAIDTSSPKAKVAYPNKKSCLSTPSSSSIEDLLKKYQYRPHRFDLVEQQKRYHLKTLK
ncbi:uncharacterized protein [Montipora foliosa]|uniref:uncharacterized protein n=1 Tax=Montipora foliosa TaxID=591990 RepID=UPI0035F1A2B3